MRNSWLRFPGLLGALVIVLALAAPAHAVDWSAYIDTSAPARSAPAKGSRSNAKVSKRAGKKVAKAKAKTKTKAKVNARTKKKTRRK